MWKLLTCSTVSNTHFPIPLAHHFIGTTPDIAAALDDMQQDVVAEDDWFDINNNDDSTLSENNQELTYEGISGLIKGLWPKL